MVKFIAATVTLDELEQAAVLAGLQLLRQAGNDLPPDIEMTATACCQYPILTAQEIDILVEKIVWP
ncbi:hypothetical protein [uncultured Ruegeria sp.]|uniref:hypothetical protein n=1 Tax=uncultured Ruegeria sp. TaxID=259304 RepID=UPI0026270A83|nr:hypothetical protein [uncultured Ruegeria sp.]